MRELIGALALVAAACIALGTHEDRCNVRAQEEVSAAAIPDSVLAEKMAATQTRIMELKAVAKELRERANRLSADVASNSLDTEN